MTLTHRFVWILGASSLIAVPASAEAWINEAASGACDAFKAAATTPWHPKAHEGAEVIDADPVKITPPSWPPGERLLSYVCLIVRLDVTPSGEAHHAEVRFMAPAEAHPDFESSTEREAQRWRFKPATIDGAPVLREDVYIKLVLVMSEGGK
jgi:hypothetical protein